MGVRISVKVNEGMRARMMVSVNGGMSARMSAKEVLWCFEGIVTLFVSNPDISLGESAVR